MNPHEPPSPAGYPQVPAPAGYPPGWQLPYPPAVAEPPPVPGPPPWTPGGRRSGFSMLAVFLVGEVVFLAASLLVVVPFAIADPAVADGGPLPPGALVTALIVPTALAALVAVGGATLVARGPRRGRLLRELAVAWRWRDLGIGLGFGVAGLALTLPASALWAWLVPEEDANSAIGEVFEGQRLSPAIAIAVFLGVWLVAPLCEELLFRGVLWRGLEHLRWNRWVIALATTVVFSFAHLELLRTPLLLVISIPIALSRVLTGNLLAAIVAHQANNFLPALGLLLLTLGALPA